MTPEQLREHAKQWDDDGRYSIGEVFRAHADALEEVERVREAVELLYDKWENGEDCHEISGDEMGAFLGKAFQLSKEEEDAVIALLKGLPTPSPMQIVTQLAERAEAALAEAERKCERLTWYADEFVRLEARGTYGEFRDTVSAYRAEFKEE